MVTFRTFGTISALVFYGLFVAIPAQAQFGDKSKKQVDPEARKTHNAAKQYFYNQEYESAIPLLKKAIGEDSSYIEPYMTLATIHFRRGDHKPRRKVLKTLIKKRPDFPNPYYNLASDFYAKGMYKKAHKFFGEFLKFKRVKRHYRKLARNRRDTALFRAQQKANPVKFNPKNLGKGVNSKYSEYWPTLTTDRETLYFTRRLETEKERQGRFGRFAFNEDIFQSELENNEWSESKKPSGNLNSKRNEGAITVSPNGRYIIFTGCQWPDTRGRCDLYIARKTKGRWKRPKNLGKPINTGAKETQPSISFNGETLYFASDRGKGGRELNIYRSKRQGDGSWGTPERLSSNINTNKTEQSPFIHADNQTLFFSSTGHMGMGKSDLFYATKMPNGKFSKPKNLGYPINNKGNDIGLFVSTNGRTAYFASEKPEKGYGKLDLYRFKLPEKVAAKAVTYVKGKVEDAITGQNLQAHIRIRNLSTSQVMVSTQSAKGSGRFMLPLHSDHNYAVAVTKKGYLLHSEPIRLKRYDSAKPYYLKIGLYPIKEGKKARLNNIFFELDKHNLKPTSKAELKELALFLRKNPSTKIEIQGHTDSQGSKAYNEELSKKRAKAVYDYLWQKEGIDKDRLTYKGYGQRKPVASNKSEEGRAKNRRTTFKIISTGQ